MVALCARYGSCIAPQLYRLEEIASSDLLGVGSRRPILRDVFQLLSFPVLAFAALGTAV